MQLRWPVGCLAWVAFGTGACQGEYPLDPTPCDDWCHATERVSCGYSDPAQCVAGCEADDLVPEEPTCRALWEVALACYQALPDEALCPDTYYAGQSPAQECQNDSAAYVQCNINSTSPSLPTQNAPSTPTLGIVTGPIDSSTQS